MIEQEAIRIIRHRIDTARAVCGSGKDGKAFEDLEMAIEALNKQIPKKPTDIDEECGTFVCPSCESMICSIDDIEIHKHCLICGQKLDWRDKP